MADPRGNRPRVGDDDFDLFGPYYEEPWDFSNNSTAEVTRFAYNRDIGMERAHAIGELARRALGEYKLLTAACRAITSDHKLGVHYLPYGWAGAYVIYQSQDKTAIRALLQEMQSWEPSEQSDLLFNLGVLHSEATKRDFETRYDWTIKLPPFSQNG